MCTLSHLQFSSVQFSHSVVSDSLRPHELQASLSITNSRSSLRFTSIESVMPSSYLILCHPLLLLPPIPPSIRVFSNESTLCMRWPKYWSFTQDWSPLEWTACISLHPTLCSPMDCRSPGSSVHGILQTRILEWVVMHSSRGIFFTQESNLCLLCLLHWQVASYHQCHMRSPYMSH